MKVAGAMNMQIVQTNDQSVRTMTTWPNTKTEFMAIQTISAVGSPYIENEALRGAVLEKFILISERSASERLPLSKSH